MPSENRKIISLRELGLVSSQTKNIEITGLAVDSKKIREGFLFIALNGSKRHGAEYINEAIRNGAKAVLTDELGVKVIKTLDPSVRFPYIISENPRQDLAKLSRKFWNKQPEVLVAVTGTNGKTSCAHMIASVANKIGMCGSVIGTLGYGIYDGSNYEMTRTGFTTPDAIKIQECLVHLLESSSDTVIEEYEDADDELNVSIAIMEEELKPQILEIFKKLNKSFKKLQKLQKDKIAFQEKGKEFPPRSEKSYQASKAIVVELIKGLQINTNKIEELINKLGGEIISG